jgi:hypothetical protein
VRRRFHPLAALLLLAVIHNGIAAPAAVEHAPPADQGMAHHGHDGMDHAGTGADPAQHTGPDCCDPSSCDCGCTATPAGATRSAAAAHDWQRLIAVPAEDSAGFRARATAAPFRPPA